MSTLLDLLEEDSAAGLTPPLPVVEASVVPAVVNTGQLLLPAAPAFSPGDSRPEPDVVPSPGASGQLTREEQIDSALRELENSILQKSLEQIEAGISWPKVAPELGEEEDVPEEFKKRYGDKALENYRVARANLMSAKNAPVGLKQNVAVATGIIKARAHEKSGPKILNMNLVEMPLVQINFPETEVKDRK